MNTESALSHRMLEEAVKDRSLQLTGRRRNYELPETQTGFRSAHFTFSSQAPESSVNAVHTVFLLILKFTIKYVLFDLIFRM